MVLYRVPKKSMAPSWRGPQQLLGVFQRRPHDGFGDPRKTHGPHGGIGDLWVEKHLAQLAKDPQLIVGRAGSGLAQVFEFLSRCTIVLPETLIIEFDRDIDMVGKGLREKGDQYRIAPQWVHALELWHWGLPAQLGQPFHPVGIERGEIPGGDASVEQELDLGEGRQELGRGGAVASRRSQFSTVRPVSGSGTRRPSSMAGWAAVSSGVSRRNVSSVRLLPRRRNEAFQAGEARAHDLVTAQLVTGELEQQRGFVMLQGAFPQPRLHPIEIQGRGGAKPQIRLDLQEVGRPCFNPLAIGLDGFGWDAQLLRHIRDNLLRGRPEVIGGKPQIAQGTELERKAQTGMRLAVLVDDALIVLREQEKGAEVLVGNLGGKWFSRSRSAAVRKPMGIVDSSQQTIHC